MAKIDTRRQKERLLEMRRRLTDKFHSMEEAVVEDARAAGDLSNVPTHNADRDSEGLEREMALEHSQGELLNAVEAALHRIEEGSYGKCEHCDGEVSAERLDALPHTAYCIKCEEAREQGERGS